MNGGGPWIIIVRDYRRASTLLSDDDGKMKTNELPMMMKHKNHFLFKFY